MLSKKRKEINDDVTYFIQNVFCTRLYVVYFNLLNTVQSQAEKWMQLLLISVIKCLHFVYFNLPNDVYIQEMFDAVTYVLHCYQYVSLRCLFHSVHAVYI